MPGRLRSLRGLPRKLAAHLALLRRDPEAFGRNLLQFTDPALFERRLVDVLDAVPMHVRVDASASPTPHLNVLSSALTPSGMTGGPNTLIHLALRIARLGVPVRLVTTVKSSTMDPSWFMRHAGQLLGDENPPVVPIVTAAEAANPLLIGPNDIFFASHWTTARQLKPVLPGMASRRFLYMLQEFEPAFYAWSSNHALAVETYGMDFWPVINEHLLADYLFDQGIGRFADPALRERTTVFEPAIDERLFHPPTGRQAPRPKRILFYARPTNSRNMFGLGLMALREASADPAFAGWEFIAIGGRASVPRLPLRGGHTLHPAPWMDYEGYATSLQQADILLCPMLSPHTSYPVLEMVATGGLSVTNTFATKTRAALERLSANIVAVEPTVESIAAGLIAAARRINSGAGRDASLAAPRDWALTLGPTADRIAALFANMTLARGEVA